MLAGRSPVDSAKETRQDSLVSYVQSRGPLLYVVLRREVHRCLVITQRFAPAWLMSLASSSVCTATPIDAASRNIVDVHDGLCKLLSRRARQSVYYGVGELV